MLKAIAQPLSARALIKCRYLKAQFLEWLCDPSTTAADLTHANLRRITSSVIEANWLWEFLSKLVNQKPLLERALVLVNMPPNNKATLLAWIRIVVTVSVQYQPHPPAWPDPTVDPAIPPSAFKALKELAEAFYEKGLKGTNGLPYLSDGTPTVGLGITYSYFVREFREANRRNPNPNAREVCVFCGGPLSATPEVDHWITRARFPLLSVCGDNLLPVCGDCNSSTNKGQKLVFTVGPGAFVEWFHPYFRPGWPAIILRYELPTMRISAVASSLEDVQRVNNVDTLLNLATRWTREFKAEYVSLQSKIRRRIERGEIGDTLADLEHYVQLEQADLSPSEPNYEVHNALLTAMLEQTRLEAWQVEIGL
jgi:hypothetical protein